MKTHFSIFSLIIQIFTGKCLILIFTQQTEYNLIDNFLTVYEIVSLSIEL